jgi:hypothetical protein
MTAGVSAVLEPLKVRTVTKGRAQAYQAVHCIQKWMHSNLRKEGIFRLIGETVSEDVIKDLLRKRKPGDYLISGDYSAATDNLKLDVTKAIFERILLRLFCDSSDPREAEELVVLARKVLYEHRIFYPRLGPEGVCLPMVQQATGQLMGSPLSFPILCLANCICAWISVFPESSFEDLPMLVNGDDIAFSCNREEYNYWSNHLSDFGFVKSVGKNYCHRRFLMINSEMFDASYEVTGKCHIPYYPVGLLIGRSKVSKKEDEEAPPVVVSLELCLRGSSNPDRTLLRFMAHNHKKVEEVTSRKTNLFLPISRGGLGLKNYGAKYHVGLWQRKYAAYLSQMPILRTDHFVREASEAGQWCPTYKVLDFGVKPSMDDYEILPTLIGEDGESVSEQTWLPGLELDARKQFLESLNKRSKDYLSDIRHDGPAGWRLMDPNGLTVWKTRLSGSKLRKIMHSKPLAGDLLDELPYRYSAYKPFGCR